MNHDFGVALANLKMGGRVARACWHGKSYAAVNGPDMAYLYLMHKEQNGWNGRLWSPSFDDLKAEDWIINAWQPDADAVQEPEIKVNLLGLPRFGVSDDATS